MYALPPDHRNKSSKHARNIDHLPWEQFRPDMEVVTETYPDDILCYECISEKPLLLTQDLVVNRRPDHDTQPESDWPFHKERRRIFACVDCARRYTSSDLQGEYFPDGMVLNGDGNLSPRRPLPLIEVMRNRQKAGRVLLLDQVSQIEAEAIMEDTKRPEASMEFLRGLELRLAGMQAMLAEKASGNTGEGGLEVDSLNSEATLIRSELADQRTKLATRLKTTRKQMELLHFDIDDLNRTISELRKDREILLQKQCFLESLEGRLERNSLGLQSQAAARSYT
ncbi:hypothetical protein BJ508DRAFT_305221 [Ascobolus immersus RN42]|uniref:Uncharacterized protein n=1 Tax=Ascobolus immersus RN42 TaxID=1160509 RepID=A0A3N4IMV0_ASCIM|nr:hypothetical protein BJ508DRAFT_305221 [Ascobolus immersus RN42]